MICSSSEASLNELWGAAEDVEAEAGADPGMEVVFAEVVLEVEVDVGTGVDLKVDCGMAPSR